ncbi:MAG: 5-(carboxyamino)imidazole ribonucleotide mutase [Alphaproteobacteria bacterium CG_4_10_14_0_2_um_filter_63_37]|nr:MAG: 5-(carboxyamino)imidazole ribonucleotide mutase [Proteobacteria bacterium CG1_02_64_396]PJA25165.1 MAG: 5-(carboxyamino)imidazole ribonucleotide mutase [Alphaproteobacteria bacterium CG_4_10_14_0_2_um_filter_63_37]
MSSAPQVAVLMGSDSDWSVMEYAVRQLAEFDIVCEARVMSAHRTPDVVQRFVHEAPSRGIKLFIVGAGSAAHLAGAVSAHCTLPVIGVPLEVGGLGGMDALLATVQMPAGIPVATVAVGKAGATNAGILAAQMLAIADPEIAAKVAAHRAAMAGKVAERDRAVQAQAAALLKG